MTTELLDAMIERLPRLRDQGVTHISVDPNTGAVSMLIAPKPVEVEAPKDAQRVASQDEASALGIQPGTPMPLSFRERSGRGATPAVR